MNIRIERRRQWEEAELAKLKAKGRAPADDKWKGKYVEPEPLDVSGLPTLPLGWCWASVEELGLIESGQTPDGLADHKPTNARDVPWFRVGDMNHPENAATMRFAEVWLSFDEVRRFGLHVRPAGTIVFPKRGGAIATNKKRLLAQDSTYDLNTMGIVAVRAVQQYLWTWFQSIDLGSLNNGSTVPQINHGDIAPLPAPLPPLNEQRRIVAKLEALQARSRRARDALDAVPPLLEKLRQSILAAAFRGDLTKDWRAKHKDVEPASELLRRIRTERRKKWEEAELAKMKAKGKAPSDDKWKAKYKEPEPVDATSLPELPEGWCWASANELSLAIVDCPHSTPAYGDGTCFAIDTTCIRPGEVVVDRLRRVTNETYAARTARLVPVAGDVVFAREGTVGTAVTLPEEPKVCLGQRVMLLRPASVVAARWLERSLMSPPVTSQYVRQLVGSTVPHLNVSDVVRLACPVPSRAEQEVILEHVLSLEQFVVSVGASVERARQSERDLRMATLAKAFRGELVPQDPNDEPAEAMMARVRGPNSEGPSGAQVPAAKKRTPGRTRSAHG